MTDYLADLPNVRALIAARKSSKAKEADGTTREGLSLDSQDEYSREFCDRQGWTVAGAAQDTISGRKAPIDRPELGEWLRDRAHEFDAVVAYKTDRYGRGDDTDWSRIETWAADNKKTLVMVDGSTGIRYPARNDSDYWQWSSAKRVAGTEWHSIRERNMRSQHSIRERGGVVGVPPWGYLSRGDLYSKKMVATIQGREYVPEIFRKVAAGESLRAVADWLASEGVKPGRRGVTAWSPSTLARMIAQTAYRGIRQNGEGYVLECPALVDRALWQRANDALHDRKGSQRKSPLGKALLANVLACGRCGHPMYRIMAGDASCRISYYRCADYRSEKSCGLMIRTEAADQLAVDALSELTVRVVKTERVDDDTADQIVKLRQQRHALDDLADDYESEHARYTAEIKALAAAGSAAPGFRKVASSYTYADLAAQPETLGDKLRADKVRIYASKGAEAVQRLTDATTAQLATGGPADVRYALAEADGVWIAVEYHTD